MKKVPGARATAIKKRTPRTEGVRDITEEVSQDLLMSFAQMCIKLNAEQLDGLILTAMHAKAFKLDMHGPQSITLQFNPDEGPYYTDENIPSEEGSKLILPGKPN